MAEGNLSSGTQHVIAESILTQYDEGERIDYLASDVASFALSQSATIDEEELPALKTIRTFEYCCWNQRSRFITKSRFPIVRQKFFLVCLLRSDC